MEPRRVAPGIYQRNEGAYWIRVYLGRDANGKKLYHQETIRGSLRQAKARISEVKHKYNTGKYIRPTPMTVAEYLDKWMKDWVATKRPKTQYTYNVAVDRLKKSLGDLQLQKLSPLHLQQFYREALESGRADGKGGLSPSTVNQCHRVIHRALEVAVQSGLVPRNVATATEPPKARKKAGTVWTKEELATFLQYMTTHRLYAMYALIAVTGLRRGEICGLRWVDIDLVNLTLEVKQTYVTLDKGEFLMQPLPKTDESGEPISLSPEMVAILKRHKTQQDAEKETCAECGIPYEDNGLVFCQPTGKPLRPDQLSSRDFPRYCKNAGVPRIRFHDLRHTYATYFLFKTRDIEAARDRMRHKKTSTTLDMYSHLFKEVERASATATDDVLPQLESE